MAEIYDEITQEMAKFKEFLNSLGKIPEPRFLSTTSSPTIVGNQELRNQAMEIFYEPEEKLRHINLYF